MKVGLDPHLSTLGGGERYFLVTLEEALRLPGAEVTLCSPERPDPAAWRLGVHVQAGSFRWVAGMDDEVTARSAELDLLVALVNEVPPRSAAPRGVAVVQFPHRSHTGPRGRLLRLLGVSRAAAALGSYHRFLCYSEFTRTHVRERLGVDAAVLAPPVDVPAQEPPAPEQLILAVGRYFRGGRKGQGALLDALERLDAPGWRLVLAGGSGDPSCEAELRERRARAPRRAARGRAAPAAGGALPARRCSGTPRATARTPAAIPSASSISASPRLRRWRTAPCRSCSARGARRGGRGRPQRAPLAEHRRARLDHGRADR